jgi:tetratricopeptide (TPR) repeat protein
VPPFLTSSPSNITHMKAASCIIGLMILIGCNNKAQHSDESSGKKIFFTLYDSSIHYYQIGNSTKMLPYATNLLNVAQSLHNDSLLIVAYRVLGNCYYLKDDHATAIAYYLKGLPLAEHSDKMIVQLCKLYNNIGFNYNKLGYYKQALEYLTKAEAVRKIHMDKLSCFYIYENLSETWLGLKSPDSASWFLQLAENIHATIYPDTLENYILAS